MCVVTACRAALSPSGKAPRPPPRAPSRAAEAEPRRPRPPARRAARRQAPLAQPPRPPCGGAAALWRSTLPGCHHENERNLDGRSAWCEAARSRIKRSRTRSSACVCSDHPLGITARRAAAARRHQKATGFCHVHHVRITQRAVWREHPSKRLRGGETENPGFCPSAGIRLCWPARHVAP